MPRILWRKKAKKNRDPGLRQPHGHSCLPGVSVIRSFPSGKPSLLPIAREAKKG